MYLVKIPNSLYRQWCDSPGSVVRLGDIRTCEGDELVITQPDGAEYHLRQTGSDALRRFSALDIGRGETVQTQHTLTYMRTKCIRAPATASTDQLKRQRQPTESCQRQPTGPYLATPLDTHKKRRAHKSRLSEDHQDDVIGAIAEYLQTRPGKGCTFTFDDIKNVDALAGLVEDDLFEPLLTIATFIRNTWRLRPDVRDIYGL